nr:ABC transporter permease [Lysobacter sp. GX 14042]
MGYYLNLALRSFRRNKVLTALMVLTIAVGIGATMTTLSVYFVLSGDPIPHKSGQLFHPRMDPLPERENPDAGVELPDQLTRFDAEALLEHKRGDRQALMAGGSVTVLPSDRLALPVLMGARYTSADFFPMLDAPLLQGRAWTAAEDAARARVAVISISLADTLFGDDDAVGRTLQLPQGTLEIIGVLDDWRLGPRFYALGERFGEGEDVFLPFSTSRELRLGTNGEMTCWGDTKEHAEGSHALNAPCAWVSYWVELDSVQKAAAYREYLERYSQQQREAGRFERPVDVRLHDVMDWLDHKRIVPNDVRLQMWLAFGFLLVCLVNTVGLLLAKFLRRSGEIGVRRALGASRAEIFRQCLVEAGVIGIAGGVLGLGSTAMGLWIVRQQPDDYARLAQLDGSLLLLTLAFALAASLFAGLLPAWRAMRIPPALQLKSQ